MSMGIESKLLAAGRPRNRQHRLLQTRRFFATPWLTKACVHSTPHSRPEALVDVVEKAPGLIAVGLALQTYLYDAKCTDRISDLVKTLGDGCTLQSGLVCLSFLHAFVPHFENAIA